MGSENLEIIWHDVADWGNEGQGWHGSDLERRYDRLPAKVSKIASLQNVWGLSHSSTGLCAHFNSDSTRIHIRMVLEREQLKENNFNLCSFSGVDLYARDSKNAWRWVAAPWHDAIKDSKPEYTLVEKLPKAMRKYRLYFPLRAHVGKLEIGVEKGGAFEPVAPRVGGELVYYGTSIVHGAFASRAGLGHPQMLGRSLDLPLINLGFSGAAQMEPEMAALLAELDPAVYVIDPQANMDHKMVAERAERFLRILLEKRPTTPIVLLEGHPMMQGWLKPEEMRNHKLKCREQAKVYRKLVKEGVKTISYVKGGERLYGLDGEGLIDSVHPNDLGYLSMFKILNPVLKRALKR